MDVRNWRVANVLRGLHLDFQHKVYFFFPFLFKVVSKHQSYQRRFLMALSKHVCAVSQKYSNRKMERKTFLTIRKTCATFFLLYFFFWIGTRATNSPKPLHNFTSFFLFVDFRMYSHFLRGARRMARGMVSALFHTLFRYLPLFFELKKKH